MAKISMLFGALLIALGLIGYAGGGAAQPAADESSATTEADPSAAAAPAKKKSVTALIPAFFGIGLVVCGVLALKESLLKHAMHGAATIGLLGAIAGGGRGAMGIGKFLSGDPSLNQRSFLFVWLMAILCAVFVVLCVRSFIAARKRQAAEQAT